MPRLSKFLSACVPSRRSGKHLPSHSSELSHPSFFPFPANSHSSSCFIAIGAATLADIYEPAERGKMVGIFYAAPLLGPSLGPLLGGVLAQAFSWRATMWLLAAILGIDLVLFTFFFRDTFRRERSLTYRCAVARRQSTIVSRTVRARDTINSREKASLDGSTSRSSSCGTAAVLDAQAKITLSLADVNPFPPLLPVLRRRNNVTTLFSSGSIHLPPLQALVHSLPLQVFSLHLASPSHSRALEHSPMRMTTTLSRPGSSSSPSAAGAYSVACSADVGLTGSCVG
jgi:MFS family permease